MKTLKFLYICIAICFLSAVCSSFLKNDCYFETATMSETSNETINNIVEQVSQWDIFIEAVIWKESRGNETCIGDNGNAVGVLQIHPIMVREANRILSMKGKDAVYVYDDRYSREKSIEIFKIVQDYHNKSHDFDRALQIWNKNHPESYKTQIMNKFNELISI